MKFEKLVELATKRFIGNTLTIGINPNDYFELLGSFDVMEKYNISPQCAGYFKLEIGKLSIQVLKDVKEGTIIVVGN